MSKTKNAGFTLLELLLTIVILGIVTGFTYLSVSNVGISSAREAAADMNYLLSRCRAACLSRSGEGYILLRIAEDGCVADYYEGGAAEPTDSIELGGRRVACTYNGTTALPEAGLKIGFERATGAEKTGGDYTQVQSILFSGGGRDFEVTLVPATGSHRIS